MPVHKAEFLIETVYDFQDNITERLFLEIWTDGSLTPKEAIYKSSKFIINLFRSILKNKVVKKLKTSKKKLKLNSIEPYTDLTIEELNFSVRVFNCLKKANIKTLNDLLKYSITELLAIRNFGEKSANEVSSVLKKKFGVKLKK